MLCNHVKKLLIVLISLKTVKHSSFIFISPFVEYNFLAIDVYKGTLGAQIYHYKVMSPALHVLRH